MKITEKKIIYKKSGMYAAFPSVTFGSKKNEYLVSFRLAQNGKSRYSHLHSLSKAVIARVYKNSVREIIEIGESDPLAKQDAQLFRIDDKIVLAYYFRYSFHPINEKYLFKKYTFIEYENTIALLSGVGMCISEDNGKTFSNPYIMSIDGLVNFAIRGSMCKYKKNILAAVYAYKNNNKYQCYIVASKDFIRWKKISLLCESEYIRNEKIEYVEPSLCVIDNTIYAFIRTHVKNNAYTSVSYSLDGANSFSKPQKTNIEGYPLHPLILKDGNLLLTYGHRRKPYGVRSRIIYKDEKVSFIESINNSKEIILEDKLSSLDCGYPWAIEDNDGSILCVYYGHKKNCTRFISSLRVNL